MSKFKIVELDDNQMNFILVSLGLERATAIKQALRLQKLMIDEEESLGRALVDVQNWLSEDGKKHTQLIYSKILDFLEKSRI